MNPYINLLNQVFDIEQKVQSKGDLCEIVRNVERMKNILSDEGYTHHSPIGEKYTDTRTDCTATIVGDLVDGAMVISKVIKPIIFHQESSGTRVIVQKALVIVELKK